MRVGIVQPRLTRDETPHERLDRMRRLIEHHAGADLVVLPELWRTGFCSFDRYAATAETEAGETASAMSELASQLDACLLAGSIVERDGDRLYNTSLLFGRTGELLAKYRKIHLFGFQSREPELLSRGREVVVLATHLGTLGLSTCYDLRFPELYRRQLDRGAELFLVVAAWPHPRVDDWMLLVRTRALENLGYLVAANCAGQDGDCTFAGRSCVVDPFGQVVAEADDGEAVISAEFEIETVRDRRSAFPAVSDRVLGTEEEGV